MLGDEGRRGRTSQGILDDLVVLARTEQDADRWAFVGLLHVAIERLHVEAELAEMLGLELADLQLEGHQAREPAVEEDEVDREVAVVDLHRVLGSYEAKVAAELGDEAAEVPHEGAVEIVLGVAVGEREELEAVGILELVDGGGVDLCQHC